MPDGFNSPREAELHDAPRLLGVPAQAAALKEWWLAVAGADSKTPNWDIASTCKIQDRKGLLLIEAKAHDSELFKEEAGKMLKPPVTTNARRNHLRIGGCIEDASLALGAETGLRWALSRDWNYQMANRFAWAWKLTELGWPVILVYLGFIGASEMQDRGKPLSDGAQWEQLVKLHSEPLFPSEVWNRQWMVNGQAFIPLIRAITQPLALPAA